MIKYRTAVLFGGNGFIGRHFARYLLTRGLCERVYIGDITMPVWSELPVELAKARESGKVRFLQVDVRRPIEQSDLPEAADLVVDLAAIHREPGHRPEEYFETNLQGAKNVCEWTTRAGCPTLIFTSSIAPYGPTETAKTEDSPTEPLTPYGRSKQAAEKIHMAWQDAAASSRTLLIVRPGVVFGPGEGGNVTRLIRAVLGGYFFYAGRRDTKKAGGYVKELCRSMIWVLDRRTEQDGNVALFNFTMHPTPSLEDYVRTICKVAGVTRLVPRIPYPLLYLVSVLSETVARPLGIVHPISPVRIRKLARSNNIVAQYLVREGYSYQYTLESAMRDWKAELPTDWQPPRGRLRRLLQRTRRGRQADRPASDL